MQPRPEIINEIAERYQLKLLVYFGSYLTEYFREDSDIDLAYLGKHPLSSEDKIALFRELVLAHRKSEIDLVDLQTAEPILRYEIATKGRILFEQEQGLFNRYGLFYIQRMYELRPLIEEQMRLLMKEIRELEF